MYKYSIVSQGSACHNFPRLALRDVMMGAMASQITSLSIVYLAVYSRKHQSSASLAFVRGIHRWPVNSPHKWPVTRKMFPFNDVIMCVWFKFHSIWLLIMVQHLILPGSLGFFFNWLFSWTIEENIGPCLNIKPSFQAWVSIIKIRRSYLFNGNSCTDKKTPVYWNGLFGVVRFGLVSK